MEIDKDQDGLEVSDKDFFFQIELYFYFNPWAGIKRYYNKKWNRTLYYYRDTAEDTVPGITQYLLYKDSRNTLTWSFRTW